MSVLYAKSGDVEAGIHELSADDRADSHAYNLRGQRLSGHAQGLMVKQGRKYFSR